MNLFDSPAAALDALCARVSPVGVERVALGEASGRVLARALHTDRASPAVDVSAMDGFAVRVADLTQESLPIAGDVHIGQSPPELPAGAALRIVTGGALPRGADAIVRREDVDESGAEIRVTMAARDRARAGDDVRRCGENGEAGRLVVPAGELVDPAVASALACFAGPEVEVYRRARVAVLVTGDELVDAGAEASAWQVKDSNGLALRAALCAPWVTLHALPRARDDEDAMRRAITAALADADALVVTGGVSMGVRDHVPGALAAAGVEVLFHRLPMRPGKPVLGGVAEGGRPVLALPGNPVSVLVTARRLAWPAIAKLAGIARSKPPLYVRLVPSPSRSVALWWHRAVRLRTGGTAELVETHGSGDVVAIAQSDGFVELAPNASGEGPFPFYAWCGA